jgi:hypothetical protein
MKEDFEAGFGKVVEDYWRELYCWAYKILEGSGFAHLAEDAVQEGLLSAYKDLHHVPVNLKCNHFYLPRLILYSYIFYISFTVKINAEKPSGIRA